METGPVIEPVNDSRPIGIFDSGVGGLSVASRIMGELPHEALLYYADTIHVPYGGRELSEVRGFALHICDFLVERGAKAIVMACNISSAIALIDAQIKYPTIPIIGVLRPGSRAACASGADRIGVLATKGTVDSGAYERAIHEADKGLRVVQVACPKFVPLVENGQYESDEAFAASMEALAPLADAKCETIILGCTHYPFMLEALTKASSTLFASAPLFIDPAIETVNVLKRVLQDSKLLAGDSNRQPKHKFFDSSDPQTFKAKAPALLGRIVERVELGS